MINFTESVRMESALFAVAVRSADLDTQVPTCPEWNVADLIWHLTEVQDFWGSIVADLLQSPDGVERPERPEADELADLFDDRSTRLIRALIEQDQYASCWSWYEHGQSVAWVQRRQAHEALIHRIDAELTIGKVSPIDAELAADGIDEALTTMIDASEIPEWSSFDADGRTAILAPDPGSEWGMRLGRFTGTSPSSGHTYDEPALTLGSPDQNATVRISGSAADIDLWLWGRGSLGNLRVEGDREAAAHIREAAAAATQ